MNILWIEDAPQGDQRDRILFQESGFFTDEVNRLDIPRNFDDCYAAIHRATSEYDLVVFDLNLKDFPETELVRKIAHEFGRKNTEFLEESGFYLYQQLIRQGFHNDRIVFLTGHASNGYRVKTYKDRLLETKNPEHFIGIIAKIRELLSDPDNEAFDEILQEYQTMGNIQRINEFLTEVIRKMKAGETNKDLYDRFEEKFCDALSELAPSIHKSDVANFHAWLDNRLTKRGAHFPYIALRRGIINACRYLKDRLEKEIAEWILFNRTTDSKIEKEYIRDYLSKLENFFPLNPPENAESLYYQFIKELSAEWEMSAGHFIEHLSNFDIEYRFKNNYERQMKLLRNWSSHGQIADDLCPKDAAFFFMIAMRAWFNLEFNQRMPYEKMLATLFEPVEVLDDNQIRKAILQSYCDLKRFLEDNKIYPDGNFFNQLLEGIGNSLRRESDPDLKNIVAQNAKRYFYQNLWHSIFPAKLCVKDPMEGKDSILMLVKFERVNIQDNSFPYFLARLIWNESFT
ncbi:MAG: hypothetical protein WC703_00360 [Candidatus Neomarinimicrobiota bacterium]